MRVEPQKPECRAGEGAAEDRQLLGAGEEVHEEVARPIDAAEDVRKRRERAREDGRQAGRETVQPVGEVHGVRATGHDDRDEEEIQWRRQHQQHVLEHRQLSRCGDRKSTRLNSSHLVISYAVFCLKKKKNKYSKKEESA